MIGLNNKIGKRYSLSQYIMVVCFLQILIKRIKLFYIISVITYKYLSKEWPYNYVYYSIIITDILFIYIKYDFKNKT